VKTSAINLFLPHQSQN